MTNDEGIIVHPDDWTPAEAVDWEELHEAIERAIAAWVAQGWTVEGATRIVNETVKDWLSPDDQDRAS